MAGYFRPAEGPNTGSVVLAELARLWDQAFHRTSVENRTITQQQLAHASKVPATTLSSWATGASLPRDLDQLTRVGEVLAGWAGEQPSAGLVWSQRIQTDRMKRRSPVMAGGAEDRRPGWPLEKVTDPFLLEVHRPIEADGPKAEALPLLPPYVARAHDERLARVVKRAANGLSAMAVLIGESSTGKTRACWEALAMLREQGGWRLWHPFDPTRPEAALAELSQVGPYTVVWLNETQHYLDPSGDVGERVAAALRTLLTDPGRAPVLVMGTLWRRNWDVLTRPADPDRHAQARVVLAGSDITVEEKFTGAQQRALREAAATDSRLAKALTEAEDGQITQYLAGGFELLARYHNAPPTARAVIWAAMDARRLGHRHGLPYALLEAAAPAYLTDAEWHDAMRQDQQNSDWLEQALAYTAASCKGVLGPVTRLRPRTHSGRINSTRSRRSDPGTREAGEEGGPLYRLADYLDQHSRRYRRDSMPPAGFWDAAAAWAHPGDLTALGAAAQARGLLRDAAQLYKHATLHGDMDATHLIELLHDLHPDDHRPAQWAAEHASLDNSTTVDQLLNSLREAGADLQMNALVDRVTQKATLNDPYTVDWLLDKFREVATDAQVSMLANRAVQQVTLNNPIQVAVLVNSLRRAGAGTEVNALANRVAQQVVLDDPAAVARLLYVLRKAGADVQVGMLLARDPAQQVALKNPTAVASLLTSLREVGADAQVNALANRAVQQVVLDDPDAVARLLDKLREAGADAQVGMLLARDPAQQVALKNPTAVASLLTSLREVGADAQMNALVNRVAQQAVLDDPNAVARLLDKLREAGADLQMNVLANHAARHSTLNDPTAVALLLTSLREVGADAQVNALANRAVQQVVLDDPDAVARLLDKLREVGANTQVDLLIGRLPGAGLFQLFQAEKDNLTRFRFGREPNGRPASPWGWADLA